MSLRSSLPSCHGAPRRTLRWRRRAPQTRGGGGPRSAQLRPRVLTRCLNIASPPPAPTLWVNCKFCRLLTVCSSGGEKKSYFGSLCQDQENEFRSRGEEAPPARRRVNASSCSAASGRRGRRCSAPAPGCSRSGGFRPAAASRPRPASPGRGGDGGRAERPAPARHPPRAPGSPGREPHLFTLSRNIAVSAQKGRSRRSLSVAAKEPKRSASGSEDPTKAAAKGTWSDHGQAARVAAATQTSLSCSAQPSLSRPR